MVDRITRAPDDDGPARGRELVDLLLDDITHLLPRLQQQSAPARGPEAKGFDQAAAQRKT